jgi:hypothetical protein
LTSNPPIFIGVGIGVGIGIGIGIGIEKAGVLCPAKCVHHFLPDDRNFPYPAPLFANF